MPLRRHLLGRPRLLEAVLFDLDGVLVETAEMHYAAWQRLADELGLPFDREANEGFRGVGRMECLDKLLGPHRLEFALEEKQMLAERKNAYYQELIAGLRPTDLAPGALDLLRQLRAAEVPTGLVSASKNARRVLDLLQITTWFDVIVDGHAVTRSKPDPQSFNMAAEQLAVAAARCVVLEDADAGLRAARAAGMKSIGIGVPGGLLTYASDAVVGHVGQVTLDMLRRLCGEPELPAAVFDMGPVRLSA